MNKVIITGRLTKDPEAFTTQSGVSRSTFDVAVQRRVKDKDGKYPVDFLTVVAWRQTADFCNKYLTKGRMVAVEGQIQKRSYTAQDNTKRYVTEIIADSVEPLGGKQESAQTQGKRDAAPEDKHDGGGFVEVDDEPLPF